MEKLLNGVPQPEPEVLKHKLEVYRAIRTQVERAIEEIEAELLRLAEQSSIAIV